MRAGVRGVLLRYGMTVGGGGGVVFGGLAGWRRLQRQASSTSCPWSRVWRLRCPGKVVQQGLKAQVPVSARHQIAEISCLRHRGILHFHMLVVKIVCHVQLNYTMLCNVRLLSTE